MRGREGGREERMGEKERDEGGLGGYTITKSIIISVIYSYLNSHSLILKGPEAGSVVYRMILQGQPEPLSMAPNFVSQVLLTS